MRQAGARASRLSRSHKAGVATEAVPVAIRFPDALYAQAREQFEEAALVDLTLFVVAINSWNRVNIAARTTGGNYNAAA